MHDTKRALNRLLMAYLLPKVRRVVGNAEYVSDDLIGLRMRYEAAIYEGEIAPTTMNGLPTTLSFSRLLGSPLLFEAQSS